MNEELEQLLKNLKLHRMLSVWQEQLRAAEKAQASYSEFVAGLLRAQWHDRQESALEWRIDRANLPERRSLESFPWARQPGVNRKQMRTFAELDFVAKHENLVLTGPTGIGKTWLARAFAQKACRDGYTALFFKAAELFREFVTARADGSHPKLLERLGRVDLLIVDDWAMAPMTEIERRDFLEVCDT